MCEVQNDRNLRMRDLKNVVFIAFHWYTYFFATENRWPRSPVGRLLWHHCGHQYGWSYHLHARNTEQWQLRPSAVYSKGCRALLPKTCQQNLLPKQVLMNFFPQPHFVAWATNRAPSNFTKSWTRILLKGKLLMQPRGGVGCIEDHLGRQEGVSCLLGPNTSHVDCNACWTSTLRATHISTERSHQLLFLLSTPKSNSLLSSHLGRCAQSSYHYTCICHCEI